MINCKKRRVNEQYQCHHCGLQWDIDDSDPPECRKKAKGQEALRKIRQLLYTEVKN